MRKPVPQPLFGIILPEQLFSPAAKSICQGESTALPCSPPRCVQGSGGRKFQPAASNPLKNAEAEQLPSGEDGRDFFETFLSTNQRASTADPQGDVVL